MSQEHLDPRSRVLAIDPGVNGALAVIDFNGQVILADELPRFAKSVNGVALSEAFHAFRPERVIIEKVGAMPKQGVSSTFTFGMAYGVCIGVSCAYGAPLAYVAPAVWKKHFRLLGKDKDASRETAIKLYPDAASLLKLKKHHGRADAILLARYALDLENQGRFV